MSYEDQFQLVNANPTFRGRVGMCVAEQAKIFSNDERPEYYLYANLAIGSWALAIEQILPLVASQPGMTEESTDLDILSAVQAMWPIVGERLVPAPMP